VNKTIIAVIVGLLVAPLVGGLISGLDRIITARMQCRIGPPVWQAFYDVIMLMSKDRMVVNFWQAFCAYAYVTAAAIAVVLFFMKSDLLLILFIQAVGAVFVVVGALSSTSPYSQVGAHRELLQILSYEPLIILFIMGIYIETGSFKISAVGMIALLFVTYIAEIIIDNVTARMTWRWMLGYVWVMGLTLCAVNLIWLIVR
jgi:ech hydrogenase subunit B